MNTIDWRSRDTVARIATISLGYIFAALIIVFSLYGQISIMTTPLWWTAMAGEVLAIPPAYGYMRFLMRYAPPRPRISRLTWLLIHWAVLGNFIEVGLRSIGTPSWWIIPTAFIIILLLWWLIWHESHRQQKE